MDERADSTTGAATVDPDPRPKRKWYKFPRSWKEVKQLGWKFIVAFILFYLIRDSILYILLPYLAYKGIIGN